MKESTPETNGKPSGPARWPRSAKEDPPRPKPWRTEGLPEGADGNAPRPRWWLVALWFAAGYLLLFGVVTAQDGLDRPVAVSYTEFTDQVRGNNVEEVFSRGDTIEGELKEPSALPGEDGEYLRFTTERPTFAQDDLLGKLLADDVTVRATPLVTERGFLANLLISFGPILLLVGLYAWVLRRAQKRGGGMLGGLGGGKKQKPVRADEIRVNFDDVAGIDEVKSEIYEIVDFLKNPEKYQALGAKVPKGLLLSGPPGTGKTLLARATAGEAGVPFFSASGSEFIEMIVGVGASRVRELFEEARKVAPAIIFIDEIDTIGRARGGARSVGGHDEREQTLNQILTEMDGFTGSEGVVVLAATNRCHPRGGPVRLRPRLPDRPDHRRAWGDGGGRSGVRRRHHRRGERPGDRHLDRAAEFTDALEKILLGTERHIVMEEDERRRTAYHEAGHALLGMLAPGADPVRRVSIIPRGRALGVTVATPEVDRYGYDRDYLIGRITGALGGMAAEDLVFDVVTTGAESDLETATSIARQMVGRWGMSAKIGPVTVLPQEGDPRMAGISEALLSDVDEEVRRLLDEAYARATDLLVEHRDRLEAITAALLEHETLNEAEVYAAAGIPRTPAKTPTSE